MFYAIYMCSALLGGCQNVLPIDPREAAASNMTGAQYCLQQAAEFARVNHAPHTRYLCAEIDSGVRVRIVD